MNAGAAIRNARKQAALTQEALARRAGTSQATLSAYESGRKQPSLSTFARLLAATGSRLSVTSGRHPIVEPSAAQLERAARSLDDVLALAEALPTRHERELRFPPMAPAARAA